MHPFTIPKSTSEDFYTDEKSFYQAETLPRLFMFHFHRLNHHICSEISDYISPLSNIVNHHALSAENSPRNPSLFSSLGLHPVLARTISGPDSSRSKCWHSTSLDSSASYPVLLPAIFVRDCRTLSLPHSLLYSSIIAESS